MKRPSRGERPSATTTRQIGFFLLPTRVSRTRTGTSRLRLATAHQLREGPHVALLHLAHELVHLPELVHEAPHVLDRGARAAGYPAPPRAVDDRWVRTLRGGHRGDDRLQAVELALVDVEVAQLGAHARDHLEQVRQRPHVAHLVHLLEEVVERELLLADLALELGGLVLV